MSKKFIFLVSLSAVLLFASFVFAQSFSLTINAKGYTADFSIYKVCNEGYANTEDFKALNVDFLSIKSASDMSVACNTISKYIDKNGINYTAKKSDRNSVKFENIDKGTYFVKYNRNGSTSASPFIINVPYLDNGTYVADVVVNAKVKSSGGGGGGVTPVPEVTTEKHTESVTEKSVEDTTKKQDTDVTPVKPDVPETPETPETPDNPSDPSDIKTPDNPLEPNAEDETEVVTDEQGNIIGFIKKTKRDITPEIVTDENGEPVTTPDGEYVTISQGDDPSNGTLPKTGGDKTVLLCYYGGGVAVVLGAVILFINNKRKKV